MSERNWLDAVVGWEPEGNVIETFWAGDPAIDQAKSDFEGYFPNLDASCLAIRPGEKPTRIVVTLPTSAQWGNISSHLHSVGLDPRTGGTAAIVAFEMCVRFPDIEGAHPQMVAGFRRLPQGFMRLVLNREPQMVTTIGLWLIGKYMLTDDEKKTSSPASTKKTSEGRGSTPAPTIAESPAAPTAPSASTDVLTSVADQGPRPPTG